MIKIDKDAPTESERQNETISKYRYLEFRDSSTTSKKEGKGSRNYIKYLSHLLTLAGHVIN